MYQNRKKKNIICLPDHSLFHIKNFLENKDIIELLCSSKIFKKVFGNKNLFTSIYITYRDDLIKTIRLYLCHKLSISRTILEKVNDWPFETSNMIYINCEKETYTNNSNNKKIVINDRYYNRLNKRKY